jgi:chorismate lyase/3-hydroxybenzoate synthase
MTDQAAPRAVGKHRLAITLGDSSAAASGDYNLLVGFHFGTSPAPNEHAAIVNPGLKPINRSDLYECWWYAGDVGVTASGDVRITQCEDYAVAILQEPDTAQQDFQRATYFAYQKLLTAVRQTGHQHLVKIWNYFSAINEGEGDREKYRQFSIGRAKAFDEHGILDDTVPTGTAIGSIGDSDLSIVALLSKHGLRAAENPRQISAFRYPRQYGPKSPKFSRGGCVSIDDHSLFLLSGTAAIIGHESAHPYDVALQTGETLQNLDQLCKAITALDKGERELVLDRDCVLRVYLRNPDDRDLVAARLQDALGGISSNVVFLHADICRRELMVEIDGARIG